MRSSSWRAAASAASRCAVEIRGGGLAGSRDGGDDDIAAA
jgi:hypothetical protein